MNTDIAATTSIGYTASVAPQDEAPKLHRAAIAPPKEKEVQKEKPREVVQEAPPKRVPPPSADKMKEIVKELNDAVGTLNSRLSFALDSDSKRMVVRVVDSATGETVRQIPPEDALKLSQRMSELIGVLVDKSE
jgi:uncharacterized FlaG/YvyC family protein